MQRTKIEWTDHGYTWNPITGCTKISAGCTRCYAERMAKRLAGRFGYPEHDPFAVTAHYDRFYEPYDVSDPANIFVCSMGDLFHDDVSDNDIDHLIGVMLSADWHRFLLLTKRPRRMLKVMVRAREKYPQCDFGHIWCGVTCENFDTMIDRIRDLIATPVPHRFVSAEPLLERIKMTNFLSGGQIHWVICGGETGPGARYMRPGWAWFLLQQCRENNVPFFMKQMSARKPIPSDLMVREIPTPLQGGADVDSAKGSVDLDGAEHRGRPVGGSSAVSLPSASSTSEQGSVPCEN